MTPEHALEVLLQVAQLAQSKGILSLSDAEVVAQAVRVLTPKKEEDGEEKAE